MKKLAIMLITVVCLTFTGCSTAFSSEEYGLDAEIAANDRTAWSNYQAKVVAYNAMQVNAKSFNGHETLVTTQTDHDYEVTAIVSLSLSKGKFKLVNVDSNGNVSTVAELSAGNGPLLTETRIIRTKGDNKLKLVGYDCKNVQMQVTVDYDSAVTINK